MSHLIARNCELSEKVKNNILCFVLVFETTLLTNNVNILSTRVAHEETFWHEAGPVVPAGPAGKEMPNDAGERNNLSELMCQL